MNLLRVFILINLFTVSSYAKVLQTNNSKNLNLLNQFEAKLYNGKVFYRDSIAKRLQRLEIALFGEFQDIETPIQERVSKIQNEIFAKEISEMGDRKRNYQAKPTQPNTYYANHRQNAEEQRMRYLREDRNYQRTLEGERRIFSVVTPMVQNLMRSSINAMF